VSTSCFERPDRSRRPTRRLAPLLTPEAIRAVTAQIPPAWASEPASAYADHLIARLAPPRPFAEEAERARTAA
jgi:hypothetical protein